MITAEQIKEEFLEDFQTLLDKHQAEFELSLDDSGQPLAEIAINGQYDSEFNQTKEFCYFSLPNFLYGKND